MKRVLLLLGLSVCTVAHALASTPVSTGSDPVTLRAAQLKPAFLLWQVGVGRADPSLLAENIFRTKSGGRQVWRITHLTGSPGEPDSEGYDYCDVDATTLRPIVSEMKNTETRYHIVFDAKQAQLQRTQAGKTTDETLPLPAHIYPEGPGYTAFLAALPLHKDYAIRYTALDRWREDKFAVRTLRVVGEETVATPAGSFKSYVLEDESSNGYYVKAWVLTDPPHYPVRVEYLKGSDALISELHQLAIGD